MKYVVIGASAAGISGAKTLREIDKDAEIILISEDENIYSRCIMHHYVHGIRTVPELDFSERDFIAKNNIKWIKGVKAVKLDEEMQIVKLSDGKEVSFDKLLIATGSHTFFPPIENLTTGNNIVGFRNLEDAEFIKKKAKEAKNIAILGAGLVGIDVLTGLLDYGKTLHLVEFQNHMLAIQLDETASKVYEDAFEKHGVKQYYGTKLEKVNVDENNNVSSLLVSTGEEIPCDLLIVAPGVRSNIEFLEGSSIKCDRFGLIFDEFGRTSNDNIFGAGDVSGRNPIWPSAVKEGIIAASNICGVKKEMTDFFASKSTMNFLGITTMSLGMVKPEDDSYSIEIEKDEAGNYKKIVHKDGKIHGALIQGDLSYVGILTQLIREQIDVTRVKKPLFEIDYSDFFNIDSKFEFRY